ncbi:MAG: HPr family phosphocarrier protein [Clostridiaceae bacterium]|jgi:phosphotransferase system HPr (HPr) family protein|nr:HPr family phosphocarrier protein [Clostridia bacterium]MBP6162037.1 HPr family phosphocarrier protein [Clostridia bacterium]MBP6950269.1 HPr family phosphocarrier protein [Clostridia bacterium]NMA36203.1 HPr family phosphocarrier protein [Clostridiaceae bacterium]
MSKKGVVFHCKEETLMKAIAMIIQISSHFDSSIFIEKDGRRANAKSLLGVLSLGIEQGDYLTISAEGDDKEEALERLSLYVMADG